MIVAIITFICQMFLVAIPVIVVLISIFIKDHIKQTKGMENFILSVTGIVSFAITWVFWGPV